MRTIRRAMATILALGMLVGFAALAIGGFSSQPRIRFIGRIGDEQPLPGPIGRLYPSYFALSPIFGSAELRDADPLSSFRFCCVATRSAQ